MTNTANLDQPVGAGKTFLENFIKLVGPQKLAPAILLFRIHQLRNGGIRIEDKRYLVNSREQWAELTGLTERQVKDAIMYLRDRGFIETSQHHYKRKLTLHLRYLEWVVVDAITATQVDVLTATPVDATTATHIEKTPVYTPVETPLTGELPLTEEIGPESKEAEGMPTVKEILGNQSPTTVSGSEPLPLMFVKLYAETTGKFAPTLSVVQKKLLNDFAKKVSPDGKAVMRRCCEHWTEFAASVRQQAGIVTVPEVPKVEFLNKYAHFAKDFMPKAQTKPSGAGMVMPTKKF